MTLLAAATPRAVWYLTRGAGAVTLIGLTLTVLLGVIHVQRVRSTGFPRFALDALHRNVAIVTLGVLAVHVITAIIDTFAPITIVDAFVPFAGRYRPLWLGLGALALDILLAVAITSAVRRRLGYRAWRAVHWAAYACWPIALVHGLGTGSDVRAGWMAPLTLACVGAVAAAVAWRLLTGESATRSTRLAALGGLAVVLLAVFGWARQGPLAPGWSRRSGTPAQLLAFARTASVTRGTHATSGASVSRAPATIAAPFTAGLTGRVSERLAPGGGSASVDMPLVLTGRTTGRLHVVIVGQPVDGGVTLRSSSVSLGPASAPALYTGRVTALAGQRVQALVRARNGAAMRLDIALSLASHDARISGSVSAASAR